MASVTGLTGFLTEAKQASIAHGAVLGLAGGGVMLAAVVVPWEPSANATERNGSRASGRLPGAGLLMVGATMMAAGFLMPETTFYSRGIWPPSPYSEWAVLVPAAIVVPVLLSALRLLISGRHDSVSAGVALGGAIFGTLLFARALGYALENGDPRVAPTIGAYLGLMAGALMLLGAVLSLPRVGSGTPSTK